VKNRRLSDGTVLAWDNERNAHPALQYPGVQ